MTPLITAHRGCSQLAPENTLPAIELAIQNQVDFVEIDVQETKDHDLVVIHDSHLQRLAGVDGNVWELTAEELGNLDVGKWFSHDFIDTRIPTLVSVMDLAKHRIKLNLELKSHKHEQELVAKTVALIRQGNWQKNCVVSSIDWHILRQVQAIAPELMLGPVMTPSQSLLPNFAVDFYSIHFTLATPDFVDRAHAEGKSVHAWTVNQRSDMQRLVAQGINNIITDRPMTLRKLLTH